MDHLGALGTHDERRLFDSVMANGNYVAVIFGPTPVIAFYLSMMNSGSLFQTLGGSAFMNWIYWDTFWSLLFGTAAFLTITNSPDVRLAEDGWRDGAF